MNPSPKAGLTGGRRIAIDREPTIAFLGEETRVYATPRLVEAIETTCRNLLLPHAEPGEEPVGVEIAVQHLAATLPGMTIEISVAVAAVERRRVSLDVAVRDELEEVSRGTHTRFVVDVAKTIERLKAKPARRVPT